jgi:excinuclease ABC subunit A
VKSIPKTVSDLVGYQLSIWFFKEIELNRRIRKQIAKRLLTEINNRLSFLTEVGLNYLTLNRNSATLWEENHGRLT